jgi:hypothetical protein
MPRVGVVAHGLQFLNGDVIAFVGANASYGQIQYGANNDDRSNGNADSNGIFLH